MKKQTSWGKVAEWYDDLIANNPDSFQARVILPNLLRLLEPKKGKVLDLACGQGYFSRAMNEKGLKVTGVDISGELIEIAKKNSPKEITYYVASATDFVSTLSSSSTGAETKFDVITIVLALQNIEDINAVFAECSKVLTEGGCIIVVLNHPAFRIPKQSEWGWDDEKGMQYRRINAYMSESRVDIDMKPGSSSKKAYTVSFHRPLQVYFKALAKNGFVVSRLEEWISHKESEPGPRANEENRIRKEIPMFLCLVMTK